LIADAETGRIFPIPEQPFPHPNIEVKKTGASSPQLN